MRKESIVLTIMFSMFSMISSVSITNGSFAQEDNMEDCLKFSGEWNNETGMCTYFTDNVKAAEFVDLLCAESEDYESNKAECDKYYDMLDAKKLFTSTTVNRCIEFTGELDNNTGICTNFTDDIKAAEFVDLLCDASEDYESNKAECDQYYDMLEGK